LYSLLRPLLFSLPPEIAHTISLQALQYIPANWFKPIRSSPINALGLIFPHAVGLAAGLDKNGEYLDALAKLGFSYIEIGTVTPQPQSGNPKPRLFRVLENEALINRMGFNNKGVHAMVDNLRKSNYRGILGINIGKNKDTSLNNARNDYIYCLQQVYQYASYITLNLSSPNTPDLRKLQQEQYFLDLIQAIALEREKLTNQHQRHVPLLIKISPDEQDETLKFIVDGVLKIGIEGLIATNTTCSRVGIKDPVYINETGGVSGKPLFERSTTCLQTLRQMVGDDLTIIGVGGIMDKKSAQAKINAGADLLQVYTGLIYRGPDWINELV
jgi:dihydroorotate dehydrogenase